MTPIPKDIRAQLAASEDMEICVHNNEECDGRIEWEHVWTYAGKQIQEVWAIIGCCYMHHRGGKLDKDYNRYRSLRKAIIMFGSLKPVIEKYPKKAWYQEWLFLSQKYEKDSRNQTINS